MSKYKYLTKITNYEGWGESGNHFYIFIEDMYHYEIQPIVNSLEEANIKYKIFEYNHSNEIRILTIDLISKMRDETIDIILNNI